MIASEPLQTDVLILGCGIAGGVAALSLAERGVNLTVVTRSPRAEESATLYAQGGIVYEAKDDSPELLLNDILRAGGGISYEPAVEILVREGPALVRSFLLEKIGIPFDRTDADDLSLVREGGHSLHRILHAADTTGHLIETRLLEQLRKYPNVRILTGTTAIDLLTPAHHFADRSVMYEPLSCVGAYLLDQATGTVRRCLAKSTILATGGLGQIFLRTTNPSGARGDGLAMAYRAGARVMNCEFVQFHPTAFYQANAPSFLISEAVRGAGAKLVHGDGKPFMEEYDPEWKELAPRDVVARSMYMEMHRRNVTNVYLDLRSILQADEIRSRFPWIHSECMKYGIDITEDLIPVVPAAHYFCGGVWADEWGRTTVGRLYAIGEVSCTGVHGANRLASTSLLEGLVWGHRAAEDIRSSIHGVAAPPSDEIPPWEETGTETPDPTLLSQDMTVIKHVMWNYVGLVRSTPRLQRAIRELRHLEVEIERFYRQARLTDELVGLRNAIRSALIVTNAAWENKHSIGCHYRES